MSGLKAAARQFVYEVFADLRPKQAKYQGSDADALIPKEVVGDLIAAAAQESAALTLFRNVQLSAKVASMPVLSALPVTYWVSPTPA
jgi:hypothetical protein